MASELALGLAERGHEIHVVSYAIPFRLSAYHKNVFIHQVEVASYPLFKYPPYALSLATKLVDVVQEFDLEIIHAHYAVPHAASAFLAKQILSPRRLKTVTTLHGTDITLVGADKSFYRVIQFAIENSDGVTAVSNYLRQRTIDEFRIARQIRVIHNFIDTQKYAPVTGVCGRQDFAPGGEKILLHASNFRPVKRVGDVVRIFDRVRREVPSKLLLVGEGPERLFVQQLVKELKLVDDVLFLGELDNLEEILNCADLVVLPSEQESFGLTALEAHACGVPVIAAAVGGLPEVVIDGETGFLLQVGDISEMSRKALSLLTDPELSLTFRTCARQRAIEAFDSGRIIPQYEALYQDVLAG